ncbi:hypothetical protein [Chryseobacterium sp. KCF3-3]|uniref:hypothetical protein n=1 Tax=Chryseobacterium sp. KCF3-3 TaxID=3231511 RepID=UPI0038B394B6
MDEVLKIFNNLKDYIDQHSIVEKSNIEILHSSMLGDSGLNFEYESKKLGVSILVWSSGVIDISSIFINEKDFLKSQEILNYIYNPPNWRNLNNNFPQDSIEILNNKIKIIKESLEENCILWR